MQLSYNKLAQLPATLGTLNALEYLYVRQNKLSGAALSTLGDLQRLKVLDLSANLLTSIPNEWSSLPSIEQIIMQQNQLNTAFPLFLKVLNSLSVLDLSNNNLNQALPDMNVGDFAGLVTLNLAYNDFTATISDLSALDTLQYLSLNGNALTGKIPPTLGDVASLYSLSLVRPSSQPKLCTTCE
jgi:Leucine-rich repeat (LRR) protein